MKREKDQGEKVCWTCGHSGHLMEECKRTECYGYREKGHVVRICPNQGRLWIVDDLRKGTKKEGRFSEERKNEHPRD